MRRRVLTPPMAPWSFAGQGRAQHGMFARGRGGLVNGGVVVAVLVVAVYLFVVYY